MSAQRHRRVRPGAPAAYGTDRPVRTVTTHGHTWTHERDHCDYCGQSMTGQRFRGDKCLDCRVRDGEAEVDENGEEIVSEIPHRSTKVHGPCWCGQKHGRVTPDADDDDETVGGEGADL